MVIRVKCPVVDVPSNLHASRNKRPRGDMGWDQDGLPNSYGASSSSKSRKVDEDENSSREELKKIFASIKDLSATSFTGMKKKQHKEDKLTALGAPRVKEQTMPFKMKMGILAGRKKRAEREEKEAKDAGIILAKATTFGKRNDRNKFTKRSDSGASFDVNTKGGVLHLSKSRLPTKLTGGHGKGPPGKFGGKFNGKGGAGGGKGRR
jgi:Domain of unknown function (DUF4602)